MAVTDLVANRLEERARARTDRLYLACEVLGYDFSEATHKELFDQYPAFFETDNKPWVEQFQVIRDILILWPRGHFKTTAVIVLCIQAILCFPDIRILLMQGTVKVTRHLLWEIATHFTGQAPRSRLNELFPEFCGPKRVLGMTAEHFTTPARKRKNLPQATVTVASPKSVKAGQHYDIGIFDDLVNDQNYRSQVQLEKVEEDFNMCGPLIDPGCPRFVSGTRYAHGDLYENIIRRNKGEWIVSVKTCWRDDGSVRFPQVTTFDGRIIGFTREMLLQIMRDTPGTFASQYLNQPALESQQVVTQADLEAALVPEPLAPALSPACLFVDLATEGTHPDDSVVIAGKVDAQGVMYVVDGRGGTWTVMQLAYNLIDMALKHRPQKILIEKTASAQYFVEYLRMVCKEKGVFLPLDYIKVDNKADAKNIRVQTMAAHVKNKRLKFYVGLTVWDKLVEQSIQFPKGRHGHDDYPDTVALMCQSFGMTYVGMPSPQLVTTQHPVIALMDRDPVTQQLDTMGKEYEVRDGDLGSDFSC